MLKHRKIKRLAQGHGVWIWWHQYSNQNSLVLEQFPFKHQIHCFLRMLIEALLLIPKKLGKKTKYPSVVENDKIDHNIHKIKYCEAF